MKKINIIKENKKLLKYAQASIIEEVNGTFKISSRDTSTVYLTVLALLQDSITEVNNFKVDDYDIKNQSEKFYSFKTSDFNTFMVKTQNKFKFLDNIKQGTSGNISLSFFSSEHNNKVINQDAYNIIKKTKIQIILEKDGLYYIEDINNIIEWDNFIENTINTYIPRRIILSNVNKYEANVFYLKPINAYLNNIYDEMINVFSSKHKLLKMSGAKLRTYDFDISEYLSGTSNDRYYVKITDNRIEKIYLLEKSHLFLFYEMESIHNFDEDSLIKKTYNIKKEHNFLERIDPIDLYSEYYNNHRIDKKKFFLRRETDKIEDIIEFNTRTNNIVLINENDEQIVKRIEKNNDNNIFEINNKNSQIGVFVRMKHLSDIEVTIYDRKYNKSNNIIHQLSWYNLFTKVSFEREKTLSVLYIEKFVKILQNKGHTNIKIELEKPSKKVEGGNGFLDLLVLSNKNGKQYGQMFEFKALYNYTKNVEETCQEQADNYDIKNIIDKNNIQESYKNLNYKKVELINLI